MSEERQIYKTLLIKCAIDDGKKQATFCKIELYSAEQWRRNYKPYKRNVYPRPPHGKESEYWSNRYRVRFNGRWLNPGDSKYTFFTKIEVLSLVEKEF